MYKLSIKNKKLFISMIYQEYDYDDYLDVEENDLEIYFYGIYGQINFNNSKNLIFITKADYINDFDKNPVFEIKEIKIISLNFEKENNIIKNLIYKFFKIPGVYFSESRIHEGKLNKKKPNFLFNKIPIKNFELYIYKNKKSYDFFRAAVYCIQGYFYKYNDLTLIARRSYSRSGTRYFSRGCDKFGNCSNFVEIEQIFKNKSFTQVRGSIPLKWKQPLGYKYNPPFFIPEQNNSVFQKSHNILKRIYNINIKYLNLIKENGRESKIYEKYNYFLKFLNLNFFNFNFKEQIEKTPYHILMEKIEIKNLINQNEIIRTNCIDCLDRTNKMQYFIGREVLLSNFLESGIIDKETYLQYKNTIKSQKLVVSEIDNFLELIFVENKVALEYLDKFAKMYEDLGNNISVQYAGTPAMSSSAIGVKYKSWKEPLADLYKSISRYFINRLQHGELQNAYEIVSGYKNVGILKTSNYNYFMIFKILIFMIFIFKLFFKKFESRKNDFLVKICVSIFFCISIPFVFPINYPSKLDYIE